MLIKTLKTEKLETYVYDTRSEMGKAAAKEAARAINEILKEKEFANVIFAAAPSQNEMLASLLNEDIDFSRVNAFHMDEYVGLGIEDGASFARYLSDHIFSLAGFASVNLIPAKNDIETACEKYTELLEKFRPDVVCMGIGENGHIAFNDPPVADFNDPKVIKEVQLDEICRMQQVHDGCFPSIDKVPKYALTLTIPTLMSAKYLICTVPAITKANAVEAMLFGKYGEICPATSLRTHSGAKMFLDRDSASKVI
ncbi:MAG: 6-phosphogluconolactonase [Clostridia bacterium]|nr:6-phosphogluconolactonase [Clostridia bacterium]MBR3714287.1 6-phosphogluconolactonase [Clostridia bacterium]